MARNGIVVKGIAASTPEGTAIADVIEGIAGTRDVVAGITAVFGTSADTELDRVRIVRAFLDNGFSQREMIAAVIKANRGRPVSGFGKGTVARYAIVANHITRSDLPTTTAAQGKRATLALVALVNQSATAADVAGIVDLAVKETGGPAFVKALETVVAERGKALYRELTAPRNQNRNPQPPAPKADAPALQVTPNAPAAPADETPDETPAAEPVSPTRKGNVQPLMEVTTARLLTELARRIDRMEGGAHGFTAAHASRFDEIATALEAATAPVLTDDVSE